MSGINYALMTVDEKLELEQPYRFDDSTYVISKRLKDFDLGESQRTAHWKEWLGSIRWDEINRSKMALVTWCRTGNPKVVDGENNALSAKVSTAWYAFLVSHALSPHWSDSPSISVSGDGQLVGSEVVPDDVHTYAVKPQLIRPAYDASLEFMHAFKYSWKDETWLDNWKRVYEQLLNLQVEGRVYAAFSDLLESFVAARSSSNLTTCIARLVEAIEGIVALPKGQGKRCFADRCSKLLNASYAHDPYLTWNPDEIHKNLVRIYDIRINRNHGKGMNDHVPEVLGEHGKPMTDHENIKAALAKLNYLAEIAAKEAIRYVLDHPDKYVLVKERSELERAWATGSFK